MRLTYSLAFCPSKVELDVYVPVYVPVYVGKEYMNQGALPGALAMQERRGSQLNITSIRAGTWKEGYSQRTCRLSAAGIAHVYIASGKTPSPVSLMTARCWCLYEKNECNMNHRCRCTVDAHSGLYTAFSGTINSVTFGGLSTNTSEQYTY